MDEESELEVEREFGRLAGRLRTIDYATFAQLVRALGLRVEQAMLQAMISAADADLNGFLDLTDALNAIDFALLRSLPIMPAPNTRAAALVRIRRRPAGLTLARPGFADADGTVCGASEAAGERHRTGLKRIGTVSESRSEQRIAMPSAPRWTPAWWIEQLRYATRLGAVVATSVFVPSVLIYLGYQSPAAFRPFAVVTWHLAFYVAAITPMLACSARSCAPPRATRVLAQRASGQRARAGRPQRPSRACTCTRRSSRQIWCRRPPASRCTPWPSAPCVQGTRTLRGCATQNGACSLSRCLRSLPRSSSLAHSSPRRTCDSPI